MLTHRDHALACAGRGNQQQARERARRDLAFDTGYGITRRTLGLCLRRDWTQRKNNNRQPCPDSATPVLAGGTKQASRAFAILTHRRIAQNATVALSPLSRLRTKSNSQRVPSPRKFCGV